MASVWSSSALLSRNLTLIFRRDPSLLRHLSTEKPEKKKTVFLPKTDFVNHVKSTERALLDQHLAIAGGLNELYEWQRTQTHRNQFELLDGPPFANGVPHTGHAINKILKDFIVKSRIALGYKVRFRPGWDCHGLPIELKITKNVKGKNNLEIRRMAREVANEAIAKQMHGFRRWGVSSDWENPYLTMNKDYVAEQLRMFGKLISKGLVYRSFKPVYWSPSSKSALAESELEYNDKHHSTSAYFRFKAIDISPDDLSLSEETRKKPTVIYLTAWTSTPWTLPLNNAISVSEGSDYVAVQFDDEKKNPVAELYVVAKELFDSFCQETKRPMTVVGNIKGRQLAGKNYQSCWYNELALPVVSAGHVTMTMGTGLVHTAYAHGHQDYNVALERGEKVESFVDENGCYTRQMGHDLEGKDVLGQGQKEVLRLLKKDFLHICKYTHSYPYDWRTKKPVIIRSSAQWFIDVAELGKTASGLIKDIQIGGGHSDLSSNLKGLLATRPSWCISRQRAWGTPIPAVFDAKGKAYFSEELADRAAELVSEHGSDYWWTCDVQELLTEKVKRSFGVSETEGFSKSLDIMDVWIDSGMAWHCARQGYNGADPTIPSDVVLEGVDQFRGWFQSLLLTSCAINNSLPYKRVLVHGFCVDDNNKKMSKSIGNVVDPELVTDGSLRQKALGADGLRLWVALAGAESAGESKIGEKVLADIDKKLVIMRNSLRFLLGGTFGYKGQIPKNPPLLDQYILREVSGFVRRTAENYEQYKFRTVVNDLLQFTQRTLSGNYVSFVRDRLYCAPLGSDSHISAQFTLHRTGSLVAHAISPLLPHLSAEFFEHQPHAKEKKVLRSVLSGDEGLLPFQLNPRLDEAMELVMKLRTKVAEAAGPKAEISKLAVNLSLTEADLSLASLLQSEPSSFHSELVELLGVSHISLSSSSSASPSSSVEIVSSSPGKHCERCRKMNRRSDRPHCDRCAEALLSL